MNIFAVIAILAAALFAVAYFTRRRFGVLGLALCAGSLLSGMWASEVTPLIRSAGVELLSPPLASVVGVSLVLLPAVLLLFSGPTYQKRLPRVIGAGAFALLATALVLQPLAGSMVLDDTSKHAFTALIENRNSIITAAIAYAVFDLLTLKTPKKKDEG